MIDQDIIQQYKNTNEGVQEKEYDEFNKLIQEQIELQYIELENLGIDFIGSNIIKDELYIDFITYVDESYVPIINIQNILDNAIQLQIIGKNLYELLCIDIVNDIIPKLLKYLDIQNSYEIELLDQSFIKNGLFNIGKLRLINLNKIIKINKTNPTISNEIIKYGLFIDLIDNNIESFLENYIIPISKKYASVFYSKTPYV
jgi:hypothetical protein